MKRVGSTKDVDVAVQFDRRGNGKTYRYHLRKGTTLAADVVQTLGETDTGDPAVAIDFFTWGMQQFPSEKVLAIIWNHGSGIDEADVYARAKVNGIRIERHGRPRANTRPRSQARAIATSKLGRALFSTTVDSAIRLRAIAYDDTNRDFLDNAELKRVLVQVECRPHRFDGRMQHGTKAYGGPHDASSPISEHSSAKRNSEQQ